ncbi:dephospho-CoA kinase-domain-containing protein [Gorgonomyces haynaldii]|nr:dephospho-CoA kinase-domain-containing protein [Gorgonomyces haynaldii]
MHLVGLTGGIATGKSTVSQMLKQQKTPIVDADLIARKIVERGEPCYFAIIDLFGLGVVDQDGNLNRPKIGQLVFSDQQKRRQLNAITHPVIRLHMLLETLEHFIKMEPLVILDTPLLFEAGLSRFVHTTAVVYCPEDKQKERLMMRDHFSEDEAQQRMNSQMPIEQKKSLASVVIDNSHSLQDTQRQVDQLLNKWKPGFSNLVWYSIFVVPALFGYLGIRLVIQIDKWSKVGFFSRPIPTGQIAPAL